MRLLSGNNGINIIKPQMASSNKYKNFVRPASTAEAKVYTLHPQLRGDDARQLYLEEVQEVGDPEPVYHESSHNNSLEIRPKCAAREVNETLQLTDKDLLLSAQNNDVDTLKSILDVIPDKINILDDYGWSLLMIACQANSVDSVKELLSRDIDTSIRDKAGNSANSLVIKNRNLILADLLLSHRKTKPQEPDVTKSKKVKHKEETYNCTICNKVYPDKDTHLSSTVHNINASKGKKIPVNYVIPNTNKGYQIMLRTGWDRESGLGPDGSGKKYPIKAKEKKDRHGLGHDKKDRRDKPEPVITNSKTMSRDRRKNRRMEIQFRREFY